jgi:putative flippase GtrA
MIAKLTSLLKRPVYRYIIVGGSVYVFELLVIAFVQWNGGSGLFAVALSFWLGLFLSFGLQKLVTFGDKRLHRKVLLVQVAVVTALVLFNFGFTLLATKLLSPWVPAAFARTLALGVTTLWNYHLYKTRIFRVTDKTLLID